MPDSASDWVAGAPPSWAMRDALAQYLLNKGLVEELGEEVADAVMVFLSEWAAGVAAHG